MAGPKNVVVNAIYKYEHICRHGSVSGIFSADMALVEESLGKTFKEYEPYGNHSGIVDLPFTANEVIFVTDDPSVVGMFEEYNLLSGVDPLYNMENPPE